MASISVDVAAADWVLSRSYGWSGITSSKSSRAFGSRSSVTESHVSIAAGDNRPHAGASVHQPAR